MSTTLVAVHGNGGGAFRFSLMSATLPHPGGGKPLAFHAVTLPGFEGRPLPRPVSIATYSEALAEEVGRIRAQAGPGAQIVVLGHGIGGSIAMDAFARHPGVAEGLILHALVGANLDQRWIPRAMSTVPARKVAKYLISSPPAQWIGDKFLFQSAPPGFARRFLAEYRRCESFSPMFDVLTAEWFDNLAPITAPTTLLWGQNDRVLNAAHVEVFETKLANSRTVIQPDWGHFPMIDSPEHYGTVVAKLATDLIT